MSTATAIGLVSATLRKLLQDYMKVTPKPKVTILAPDESEDPPRINLFLYKIQENPALRNLDWQVKPGYPNQLMPPPLSLNLFYLMTPYTAKPGEDGIPFAHAILGDAMRVFNEYPIIPQDRLSDAGLMDVREQIRIMLSPVDLDELSRVWSTFTQPYRLSVMYEVSVVQLDMLADSERPMATRVRQIGVPDVRAPYRPPVLHQLEPASGPAGTTVTVAGKNLAGRMADVRVMGRQILEVPALANDTFEVPLPDELRPGFHEIQVDISHLCRRTFFFEVTPAVDRMDPLSGPAGTAVTFYGRDLAGQPIVVTTGDLRLLDVEELPGDEFQVTVPDDLPAGSHDLQVEISDVYVRTFSFEVTA